MQFIKLNECSSAEMLRSAVQKSVSALIPEARKNDKFVLPGNILWDSGEISLGVPRDVVFLRREDALELLRHAKTRGEIHALDFALRDEPDIKE